MFSKERTKASPPPVLNPSSSLSSLSSMDRDTGMPAYSRSMRQSSPPYNNEYSQLSLRRNTTELESPYKNDYGQMSLRRNMTKLESPYNSEYGQMSLRYNTTELESEEDKHGRPSLTQKRKKGKKKSLVTADLSGTRYSIVRHMVEHLGYTVAKEDDANSFLFWNDAFVSTEKISDMKPYQHINHFPGMGEITRKDCLAKNMSKIQKVLPEEYNFVPRSWILPADYSLLQSYYKEMRMKKKNKTFIIKPPNGSQGHGICLYKNAEKIPSGESNIVQEYVDKPLLIEGYKFDLRIYVLITSCDPLRIFLYDDGLVRLSTEKYLPPQENNTSRLYMHLTNYSINKHNDYYEKGSTVELGSKRSIRFFNDYLRRNDYDVALLWKNISELIVKTMIVAEPYIQHSYRMCRPGFTSGSDSVCFEILGFDVIIDRKLRPWLLEVNRSPSFGTDEKIDYDIKSGVIEDTLRLLNIKLADKKRNMAAQKAEAQKRLLRPTKRVDVSGELPESEKKRQSMERRKEELKDLLSRIRKSATREDYENRYSGRFRRIFPTEDRHRQEKYTNIILSSFQTFLSSRAASMQRELQLAYNNKLREQDVLDMLADIDAEEKDSKGTAVYKPRGPKPLSSMPPSVGQSGDQDDGLDDDDDDDEDEDDDSGYPSMHRGRENSRLYRPGSAYHKSQPDIPRQSSAMSSRPNSGQGSRPGSRRSRSLTRPGNLQKGGFKSSVDDSFLASVVREREDELNNKTLSALNDMRIKFPGKTDNEAEWILDKLHENWKFHKPRIASYWLVKLDSIKRRKVIDIVRSNVRAVLQRTWQCPALDNLRLTRILNRVFNRLLWSHGQGLWNCFSSTGNSWETIFSKSSDSVSETEMNCCRRIVQLCRDCLLIVYQFAAEAKTAAATTTTDRGQESSATGASSDGQYQTSSNTWNTSLAVGQRVVKTYQTRADTLRGS